MEILVVDDHPLMRAGLECMLDAAPDLHVAATAGGGVEAVELAERLHPDVVLLDLSMPELDGISATRLLRELQPPPVVVVLTSTCSAASVRAAFTAGAAGYLLKDTPPEALLTALRGLREGRPALDPRAARILLREQRWAEGDARVPGAAVPSGPVD